MNESSNPQCFECKYYIGDCKCKAYPNSIPMRILLNEVDHSEPHKGDNGIRFERR